MITKPDGSPETCGKCAAFGTNSPGPAAHLPDCRFVTGKKPALRTPPPTPPAMQRRHYKYMAWILAKSIVSAKYVEPGTAEAITKEVAYWLGDTNAQFDARKFEAEANQLIATMTLERAR